MSPAETAFVRHCKQSFPAESRAIDQYLYRVDSCVRASRLFFAEKALPPLLALLAGPLLRAPFLRRARHTTAQVLGRLTRNRQLIGVLTGQWGDYGLPPAQSSFGIHAMIANHYLEGAAYPVGGASRIAATIVPVIERAGGRVLLNAEVTTNRRRRRPSRRRRTGRWPRRAGRGDRQRRRRGQHVFAIAAGRRGRALSLAGKTPCRRAVAGPRQLVCRSAPLRPGTRTSRPPISGFIPRPTTTPNLAAYLADPAGPLPFVYISFPSAKDPTFAQRYPGRATLQLIAPARYDWFRAWQDAPWKRRGEELRRLEADVHRPAAQSRSTSRCQAFAAKSITAELSTPLSTRHFAGYAQGEPYGLAHTPARFAQRFLRPRTPIRNLYLTGQDIAVCGIAGGLVSGILTASSMLGRNLFK